MSGVDANGDDPLMAEMGAYVVDLADCPTLKSGARWLPEGPLGDVAVAPGTSPTSWYSTPENVQHIAYVQTGQRIHALFKAVPSGAPWANEAPLGEVAVAPGTSPTSWYTTPENFQHIAYVGTDQRIYALFKFVPSGAPWGSEGPLGDVAVAPRTSPTSWYTTPENVQHIAYVGTDQRIHALFKAVPSGGAWGSEGPLGDVAVAPGTSPTSWYTTPENVQHIAYVQTGQRIHALFKAVPSGAPWANEAPLGDVAVAPGTSPTSWYTTPENFQHIAYVGTDQRIYALFKFVPSGAPWGSEGPLGDVAVAPRTSPTSWYTTPENVQHIAYVQTGQRIHALFKAVPSGGTWANEAPLGDVAVAPGTSPTSWYTTPENVQHIAYVGVDPDHLDQLRIYSLFYAIGR